MELKKNSALAVFLGKIMNVSGGGQSFFSDMAIQHVVKGISSNETSQHKFHSMKISCKPWGRGIPLFCTF